MSSSQLTNSYFLEGWAQPPSSHSFSSLLFKVTVHFGITSSYLPHLLQLSSFGRAMSATTGHITPFTRQITLCHTHVWLEIMDLRYDLNISIIMAGDIDSIFLNSGLTPDPCFYWLIMTLGSGLCLFRSRGWGAGVRSSWGWMFQFFGFHCATINKKSSIPIIYIIYPRIGCGLFHGFGSKFSIPSFGEWISICQLFWVLTRRFPGFVNHFQPPSKWQAPAVVRRLEFP